MSSLFFHRCLLPSLPYYSFFFFLFPFPCHSPNMSQNKNNSRTKHKEIKKIRIGKKNKKSMADIASAFSPSLHPPPPLSCYIPNAPVVAQEQAYPVSLGTTPPPSPPPTSGDLCGPSCRMPTEGYFTERRWSDLLRQDLYGPRIHPRYTFPSSFSSSSLRLWRRTNRRRPPFPASDSRRKEPSDSSFSSSPPSLLISKGDDVLHPLVVAPLAPHTPSSLSSASYNRTKTLTRRLRHQCYREAVKEQIEHLRHTFLHGVLLSSSSSSTPTHFSCSGFPSPPSSQEEDVHLSERNTTLLCSALPHFPTSSFSSLPDDAGSVSTTRASASRFPTVARVHDTGHLLDPIVWMEGGSAVGQKSSHDVVLECDWKQAGKKGETTDDDRPAEEPHHGGPQAEPLGWKEDEGAPHVWSTSIAVLVRPLMEEVLLQRVLREKDLRREEIRDDMISEREGVPEGCPPLLSLVSPRQSGEGSAPNDALSPSEPFVSRYISSFLPRSRSSHHYREWRRQEAIQRAVGKSAQEALIDLQVDQRYRQPGQFLRRQHRVR